MMFRHVSHSMPHLTACQERLLHAHTSLLCCGRAADVHPHSPIHLSLGNLPLTCTSLTSSDSQSCDIEC